MNYESPICDKKPIIFWDKLTRQYLVKLLNYRKFETKFTR